jgi:hypothetical protein
MCIKHCVRIPVYAVEQQQNLIEYTLHQKEIKKASLSFKKKKKKTSL